jgi:HlyD family secretion protein
MSEQRKKRRKRTQLIRIVVIAAVVIAAGLTYYFLTREPAEETTSSEPSLQTATVRQGDLELVATGAGTLTAGDEVTFGFDTEGTLEEVLVSKGDSVEAGDLLARLDDADAQEALADAQLELAELTSTLAIAEVKVNIATLEETLNDAYTELAYLISPAMLYYEERLAEAQTALEEATAAGDEEAISTAEAAVTRAEANLYYYGEVYEDEYVPETFAVEEQDPDNPRETIEVIYAPTTYAINNARNAYEYAIEELKAANDYLTALQTGEIPEGAMGSDIATLRAAMEAVEDAEEDLDNVNLYAPIPGVITALNAKAGEEPDDSFITILDLYHPYLEIYLDASDWDMLEAGSPVEVVFDSYPDLIFSGSISYIDPFITSTGGASLIYGQVSLDEDSLTQISNLPIGSEATVDVIQGSATNATLVPVEALHEASGKYSVFVVENGETSVRFVEVGLMDTYYAEILSGLEVGEVVTTGIVETN